MSIISSPLQARTDQPLRVALARACGFRPVALAALDAAGYIPEDAVEGDSDTVIEATVAAGIAVTARIEGVAIAGCEELGAASGLPELGHTAICFYDRTELSGEAIEALRKEIRLAYGMVDA